MVPVIPVAPPGSGSIADHCAEREDSTGRNEYIIVSHLSISLADALREGLLTCPVGFIVVRNAVGAVMTSRRSAMHVRHSHGILAT